MQNKIIIPPEHLIVPKLPENNVALSHLLLSYQYARSFQEQFTGSKEIFERMRICSNASTSEYLRKLKTAMKMYFAKQNRPLMKSIEFGWVRSEQPVIMIRLDMEDCFFELNIGASKLSRGFWHRVIHDLSCISDELHGSPMLDYVKEMHEDMLLNEREGLSKEDVQLNQNFIDGMEKSSDTISRYCEQDWKDQVLVYDPIVYPRKCKKLMEEILESSDRIREAADRGMIMHIGEIYEFTDIALKDNHDEDNSPYHQCDLCSFYDMNERNYSLFFDSFQTTSQEGYPPELFVCFHLSGKAENLIPNLERTVELFKLWYDTLHKCYELIQLSKNVRTNIPKGQRAQRGKKHNHVSRNTRKKRSDTGARTSKSSDT